jgi:hypothetical protein
VIGPKPVSLPSPGTGLRLIGAAWGLLAGLLAAGPAAAQFEPDSAGAAADSLETDGFLNGFNAAGDDTAAAADSLAARRRRGESGEGTDFMQVLKPSYATSYNVFRQTTNWDQSFDFGGAFEFLNFTNKTNFTIGSDSGRDESRRNGTNQTSLRFSMIKKLPVIANANIGRSSVVRPGDERETNDAAASLNTNYSLTLLGVSHNLSGGGGYSHRRNVSVGKDSRSESTDGGWSGNLQWRGNWTYRKLSVGSSYRETRSTKTSVLTNPDGSRSPRPTRNTNRTYGVLVNFTPLPWVRSNVTLNNTSGNDEFFIVQGGEGSLEQKVNENQSIRASLNLTPYQNLKVDWAVSTTSHNLEYQVRRDIASSGDGISWEGTVKTKILDTDVEGSLTTRNDTLKPATSADTETRNNVFDGKVSRTLSEKLKARVNWLVRATQLFYSDPDPDRVLDRDEVRTKFQPALTYTPSDKWEVTASFVRSTSRRIELNPTRARQTQEDEDYSVDFEILYRLSRRTQISQNYSIQAVYTTFDYNRGSDRLLSTQRIVTSARTEVTPKVNLSMEHRFTLQDSGPFRFDPDGTRVFTRNLRKYRQELTATVGYRVAKWLTLTADSRFLRTDDVQEATGRRTTTRNLDLRQGADVRHNLGLGAKFSASAEFVRSSSQESYWTISSSLSKEF